MPVMGSGRFVGGLEGTRGIVALPGGTAPQSDLLMAGGSDGWLGPVTLPGGAGCSPNTPGTILYQKTIAGPLEGTAVFPDAFLLTTITDIPLETVSGGNMRLSIHAEGSATTDPSGVFPLVFLAGFDYDPSADIQLLNGVCVRAVGHIPPLPPPTPQPFDFTDPNTGLTYAPFTAPGCGVHQDLMIWIQSNNLAFEDTTAILQNFTITVTEEGP